MLRRFVLGLATLGLAFGAIAGTSAPHPIAQPDGVPLCCSY